MTYKYEASIKEAINVEYHAYFSGYMNRIKELEETYDKARKYDVIEFKARAFDDVIELQKLKIERFKKRIDSTDDLYFKDKYRNSIERAENIIHVLGSHLS